MLKIAIGLPTNRLVKPKTAESLMKLVDYSNYDLEIIVSTRGYNTAENRNWITAQAVKKGCDYLFMVDDDMIYEPDTLERLVEANRDIIGGLYYTKYEDKAPVLEYFDKPEEGLFKVKAMGGGLILIKCDVFKKVPQPWYGYKWNNLGAVTMSNDWFFCEKAREAGFDIWCDSSITAEHMGLKEY